MCKHGICYCYSVCPSHSSPFKTAEHIFFCTLCSTFNMEWNAVEICNISAVSSFKRRHGSHTANFDRVSMLPCLLLRSILRHIISLVPSLSDTTPSPLATARASDSALAVDYAHAISANIVLHYCTIQYLHFGQISKRESFQIIGASLLLLVEFQLLSNWCKRQY